MKNSLCKCKPIKTLITSPLRVNL